jgi:hypothetical protein
MSGGGRLAGGPCASPGSHALARGGSWPPRHVSGRLDGGRAGGAGLPRGACPQQSRARDGVRSEWETRRLARVLHNGAGRRLGCVEARRVLHSRMEDTSGTRGSHWGLPPSSWQVPQWASWNTFLGYIWAEMDYGPKIKVKAHTKVYNLYLRCKVIRATN